MTSLDFFPNLDHSVHQEEPPQWGTGQLKSKVNIWAPKGPNWHQTGEPIEQYYDLTQLKRSNVRSTDQLLPNPEKSEMHKLVLEQPFPAEHPYSSHQSRFAVFPKYDSPLDPKRGVSARRQMPNSDEMPSNPSEVIVLKKTKGNGFRHELQLERPESLKKPLEWHEHSFNQLVKSPSSGKQDFYPVPPKTYVANLEERSNKQCEKGDMEVSERSSTALRNVERNQWQTTYDLNHTGIGPSNALELDNMEEKKFKKLRTGMDDDSLHPRSTPNFDPARPKEGRIFGEDAPTPRPQTDRWPNPEKNTNYIRPMSNSEKEEHRLWNGTEYVNLPDTPREEHQQNGGQCDEANTSPFVVVPQQRMAKDQDEDDDKVNEMDKLCRDQYERHQQVEAQNRWQVLEAQKPHHDRGALQRKLEMTVDKTQPNVFYKHEGRFQRERAGMYKTSYDPYSLQYSMNKLEKSGPVIMDTSDSHVDALNLPVKLNNEMAEAIRFNRTMGIPGSVPQYNDQPSQFEAIGPFDKWKSLQKGHLQPNEQRTDVRTLEKGIILKESSYGDCYNTEKFLQDHELPLHSRNEPLNLMSKENQNLNRVRVITTPRPLKGGQFTRSASVRVTTRDGARNGEFPVSASVPNLILPERNGSGGYGARPCTAPEAAPALAYANRYSYQKMDLPSQKDKSQINAMHSRYIGTGNQATSKSTTSLPMNIKPSGYPTPFPGSRINLSIQEDPRFTWKTGQGTPRPHSTLLRIQDSFSKTDAKRRFYDEFPETNPDLRENIIRGKRHEFAGMNAQILRGAEILV